MGRVRSAGGRAVSGVNSSSFPGVVAVYGETGGTAGYAGYFVGRGYFSSEVGIGVSPPTAELDVAGTVQASGFRLSTAPQDGYVLTSNATGDGSWQPAAGGGYWEPNDSNIYYNGGNVGIGDTNPTAKLSVDGGVECSSLDVGQIDTYSMKVQYSANPGDVLTCTTSDGWAEWQPAVGGGLSLPYDGSVSSSVPAFQVTNSGNGDSSHGIFAVVDGTDTSSDAAAGFFDARGTNSLAIIAHASHGSVIQAQHDGTAGYAISGDGGGASGGGYFYSSNASGRGVYCKTTGEYSHAIYAESSGGGSVGYFEATGAGGGVGLIAKGIGDAARFYGNVTIYEHGTTNKVLELGKGLDVTEAESEDLPKGTVLVIDPDNPGHLTQCRQAYDRRVAGIVAGANGLGSGVRLGAGQFDHDVALAGRVYCNVVAFDEAIQPGDLLTTSNLPGYAAKVTDHGRAPGAVLGKAMEPMAKGQKGQILVLVTLQ